MKVVAQFVIPSLFISCLAACIATGEPPTPIATTAGTAAASSTLSMSPEEALNQYADSLVVSNAADFSGHEAAAMTSTSQPLAYVLTFQTTGSNYITKRNISDNDTAGYESNLEITNRWQRLYCTGELKSLMRTHEIFSVGGHIVDSGGQKHSIAICTV